MRLLQTTGGWKKYWASRKIDWNKAYLATWDHPHRIVLCNILKTFNWISLIEIGFGSGPNLMQIVNKIGGKQLGGVDVSADAIELANKTFKGGVFRVGSGDDVMMSDKSTDVCLSDMCLIYVSPRHIKKYLNEMKRITRNRIILCEFHHKNWWKRLILRLKSGYYAHNYVKILQNLGFYDIISYKLTPQDWPGGEPQKSFGYIFVCRVPKR